MNCIKLIYRSMLLLIIFWKLRAPFGHHLCLFKAKKRDKNGHKESVKKHEKTAQSKALRGFLLSGVGGIRTLVALPPN